MRIPIFLMTLITVINSAGQNIPFSGGYRLNTPDYRFELTSALKEVSGIAVTGEDTFACISDELGRVYFFSTKAEGITDKIDIAGKGDFEDIALDGKNLWILRSDGTLFGISGFRSGKSEIMKYDTGIPSKDNEGLCFDRANNRLLIGTKGEIDQKGLKNKSAVFAFDLSKMELRPDPVLVFDPESVKKSIKEGKIRTSGRDFREKDAGISMKISGFAIHPLSGKYFLLSSPDNMLYVIGKSGIVEAAEYLDRKLFRQPEGITFLPNGDMLISNEANGHIPTILRFNYKGSPK